MLPANPVSHAATWMVAISLFIQTPALAGQKPKDWVPGIDPANFVSRVDHPYFPLTPGRSTFFRASTR